MRLLVTVTFTVNQLRAHLLPVLGLSEVDQVTLVADRPPPPLPKVRAVVPPSWLAKIAGRAGAKLLVCLILAVRERPDWVMGFNFVPHGFNARLVAAIARSRSMYHMIGGEHEWLGGGWRSENSVLGRLPRPMPRLERTLLRLIGGCTAIATMGDHGKQMLQERGVQASRIVVMPPAVDTRRFRPTVGSERAYDVVTVSRLTENKRTADLLEAVARLRTSGLDVRVAVAGDGPAAAGLRELAVRLEIRDLVDFLGFREDVERFYASSRLFVLVSTFEGMPIAMLEAMACGLPVVVTDVGEVRSIVRDGVNGYVIQTGDVERLVERLRDLLQNEALYLTLAEAAATVVDHVSVERIGERYREVFSRHTAAGEHIPALQPPREADDSEAR